ncbi:membrane-associated protein, putative [Bodo saltans]|uniref:Membrane-associated protein, putative n=1 Tax=Bodo saltans TaxID=75058 RepID=A0A0S4J0H2_BODSA|nr:membrane-associated protein, putative [Bodo saltans]|eukprot:CUG76583.1 membrane-associated protein, putative [Bodo saltans]
MLREHRGKVIYIPIVVPDNALIGSAHILGVVAVAMLIACCSTQEWYRMQIRVPAADEYEPELLATLTFGLRSMHVSYCETYNATVVGTIYDGCGFEDVFYASCSSSNDWCASHGNTAIAFWIFVLDALIVLGTCAAALTKLGLLPTGFMIGAWTALFSVFAFRQESALFEPSIIVKSWMDSGKTTEELRWGYFIAVCSVFVLAVAVMGATFGYIKAGRQEARDEARRRAADAEAVAAEAQQQAQPPENIDTFAPR